MHTPSRTACCDWCVAAAVPPARTEHNRAFLQGNPASLKTLTNTSGKLGSIFAASDRHVFVPAQADPVG
jgi:hypothetical protein